MNIQWYPGHMAKAKRMISEHLKLVDMIIELVDARAPLASQNSDFQDLFSQKRKLILLNKSDLADPAITKEWVFYFKAKDIPALFINSENGNGISRILPTIQSIMKDVLEKNEAKGIHKNLRAMIVGIPNVGKSSFINRLSKRAVTKVGDRPGVTTQKQWIKISTELELLDTPGVLVPKFDNQESAMRLAFIGSIKDDILDVEEVAANLLIFLRDHYEANLCARYKIKENLADKTGYELLEIICRRRGFIISGGEFDYLRGANILLDEFRAGKLGAISLENPADFS